MTRINHNHVCVIASLFIGRYSFALQNGVIAESEQNLLYKPTRRLSTRDY